MKTIPEQLAEALATIETMKAEGVTLNATLATAKSELATANTNLESARASVTALTGEKAALTTQLTASAAEIVTLKASVADLTAKEQNLEKRASDRAVEIMAGVGQTTTVTTKPNAGGDSANKAALTGLAAVEASYREKYKIS